MKNKFLLFSTLICIIVILFITKLPLDTYKEGVLYSDKIIGNSKAEDIESETYITREEAVNKLITVFNKGFGININREQLTESINLYEANGDFQWSIVWRSNSNNEYEERYYCEVLAGNGVIKYIGKQEYHQEGEEQEYIGEDVEEALNIIKPLVEQLNISIEQCDVYFQNSGFGSMLVLSEINAQVNHNFKINYKNKVVTTYYMSVLNEEKE